MMLEPMKFCEPVCITGNSLSNSNSKTKIDQLKEVESPKYPDAKHAEPDFAHSHMSHQTWHAIRNLNSTYSAMIYHSFQFQFL